MKYEKNTKSRPLVLITNDDGIDSPGLHALAEALISFIGQRMLVFNYIARKFLLNTVFVWISMSGSTVKGDIKIIFWIDISYSIDKLGPLVYNLIIHVDKKYYLSIVKHIRRMTILETIM